MDMPLGLILNDVPIIWVSDCKYEMVLPLPMLSIDADLMRMKLALYRTISTFTNYLTIVSVMSVG